jgi:hypothetical protein
MPEYLYHEIAGRGIHDWIYEFNEHIQTWRTGAVPVGSEKPMLIAPGIE